MTTLIAPRTHTADGKRLKPAEQRRDTARRAREARKLENAEVRARPLEVERDWTLETVRELAEAWAAHWNAQALERGLTYDGGFPSALEVAQKNPRACVWVSGDTYPSRGQLRVWGFVWSAGRKAWYCGEGELMRAKTRVALEGGTAEGVTA